MFTGLEITDILGSRNVDNNTPFVIVSYNNIHKYLNKLGSINQYNILRINYDPLLNYIAEEKNTNEFNINNFIPVGDLCSKSEITNLILANKYVIPTTKRYKQVGIVDGMTFWTGFLKRKGKESRSIGITVTKDKNPPEYRVPVLPRSYLVKMDFTESLIAGNEFDILSLKTDGLWMIVRNKFGKSINNFKLLGLNGKYLSSNNNKLQLRDKNSSNQNVSYNAQGELVMGGMCLTTNDNKSVTLDKCASNKKQKWVPYNGNFISMLDNKFNSCLSVDTKDNVITKNCKLSSEAEWDIQNGDEKDVRNITWPTVKGKTVVLTTKDNPWFLNKDIVGEKVYINNNNPTSNDPYYKGYAKYKTNCKAPQEGDKSQGHGYSYANSLDNCVEGFSESNDNFVLLILIIILFILLIVKFNYVRK